MVAYYIWPFILLTLGVIDDLRSRKIHNRLILILMALTLLVVVIFQVPWGGFSNTSFLDFLSLQIGMGIVLPMLVRVITATILTVPLVLLKVIGGGDMKLYILLAFIVPFWELMLSYFFAFFWAGMLGLLKSLFDKKFLGLIMNLLTIAKLQKPESQALNMFPFSIGLLFGWLSAIIYV